MPYTFPKRVLQTGEPLETTAMNADWQPIGEKVAGNLNGHDFDAAAVSANALVATMAYAKPYYKETTVAGGWGSASGGYTVPTTGSLPTGAFIVPQTSQWTAISTETITGIATGVSNFWIVGWLSYIYYGFTNGGGNAGGHTAVVSGGTEAARIQVAIRVDGQVIPETITGHADDWHKSCQPLKPIEQRNSTNANITSRRGPGPGLDVSQAIMGVGPQAGAIRVVAQASVAPGTHTVELVVRVIRLDIPNLLNIAPSEVVIHNRKLFVLDCPLYPATAPSRPEVEIPAFRDGSSVSTAAMNTNRQVVLTTALNDIEDGHLARGALVKAHLPDALLDKSFTTVEPTNPVTYSNKYPGVFDILVNRTGANEGWSWIEEAGSGDLLRTDYDTVRTPGDFEVSKDDTLVVVMANVHVVEINTSASAGVGGSICGFAALALAYLPDGGSVEVIDSTEAYVNNYVSWTSTAGFPTSTPVEYDMPLFHVFNYSPSTGGTAGSRPADDIDYIGVVATGFQTAQLGFPPLNAAPVNTYQCGSLSVLVLRG